MDILEAIRTRKSIRKFTSEPVSKEVLTKILDVAVRAPSSENTQPWTFHVLGGAVLDRVKQANVDKMRSFEMPPEEMHHLLVERPKGSVYRDRQIDIAKQLFSLMGIGRGDRAKRDLWMERGFRFFDAPAAIIITADKTLPLEGTYLDVGAVMQNICLAALAFGLHTCIENQGITYSDVLRENGNIPETKRIMAALAIGYPDWDFPANQVESRREPIENTATWCGFE